MPVLLLFALLAPIKTHWVRVKDAYAVHYRWLNGYGNELGEYFEVEPGRYQAGCYEGQPTVVPTEPEARAYVLRCEVW